MKEIVESICRHSRFCPYSNKKKTQWLLPQKGIVYERSYGNFRGKPFYDSSRALDLLLFSQIAYVSLTRS